MKKYITEAIGTFFLMFTIGLCVNQPGAGMMAPLAIGSILMVMVYAGGHVSGAHYNPAITLSIWMRGKCATKDVVPYMVAQLIGSVLAVGLIPTVTAANFSMATPNVPALLIAEAVFTFGLAFVILNVATSDKTAGNSYFGLAIGFTVMAGAYAVGPISGAAFNPAVAVGITLLGLSSAGILWAFLLANFAGGALAAIVFKYVTEA